MDSSSIPKAREVTLSFQKNTSSMTMLFSQKKPLSSYFYYNIEVSKSIRQKNPEMKIIEVSKRVSEQWTKMSNDSKAPYEKLAIQDKSRYEKELKNLISKGYFLLEDGAKSSEFMNKPKKEKKQPASQSSTDANTQESAPKFGKKRKASESPEKEKAPAKKRSKKN